VKRATEICFLSRCRGQEPKTKGGHIQGVGHCASRAIGKDGLYLHKGRSDTFAGTVTEEEGEILDGFKRNMMAAAPREQEQGGEFSKLCNETARGGAVKIHKRPFHPHLVRPRNLRGGESSSHKFDRPKTSGPFVNGAHLLKKGRIRTRVRKDGIGKIAQGKKCKRFD